MCTCTPTQHADTPDTSNIGTVVPVMQTPQTLPHLTTTCRVQISRSTDTQTPPVRIFTRISNLADTPRHFRVYIYCLKTKDVQLACIHIQVHPTRHADTPDTFNISTVVLAAQTLQTLPALTTACRGRYPEALKLIHPQVEFLHIHLTSQTPQTP